MRTNTRSGAVGTLAWVGTILVAGGAGAENLHVSCNSGDLVREIEVQSETPDQQVPCEVVYRKLTEQPDSEDVLWTASSDASFCADKAKELADKLESYGWTCAPAKGDAQEPEIVEARVPPELKPDPVTTLPAAATPADRKDPVLDAAIAHDITQLKDSAETVVEADVGAFGDLNLDGVDDAAVVITFDPDGADHAQYLVAYVNDGKTYRPAASKFLGGRYREVYGGRVEGIQDGQIFVDLQVLKADDPYCCPTGEERALYALQGDELMRRE